MEEIKLKFEYIQKTWLDNDDIKLKSNCAGRKARADCLINSFSNEVFDNTYFINSYSKYYMSKQYYTVRWYFQKSYTYPNTNTNVNTIYVSNSHTYICEFDYDIIKYFSHFKRHTPLRLEMIETEDDFSYFVIMQKQPFPIIQRKPLNTKPLDECNVCYENNKLRYTSFLFNCKHNNYCVDCCKNFKLHNCNECPMCRAKIKTAIKNRIDGGLNES